MTSIRSGCYMLTALLLLGTSVGYTAQVTHTYDAKNRLIRSDYGNGQVIEYAYDAAGNQIGQKAVSPPSEMPDLIITALTSPTTGVVGGKLAMTMAIKNQGTKDSGGFFVNFYLSPDTNIALDDFFTGIFCEYKAGLKVGVINSCSGDIAVPATLKPGKYYLGAYIDASNTVEEGNETNNGFAAPNITDIGTTDVTRHSLTVGKAGSGSGKVVGLGIDCGADCTESYVAGTKVNLKAEAGFTSTFLGWSGACSGAESCDVTMDAAKQVTASFKSRENQAYALKVTKPTTGVISSLPPGILCGGKNTACSGMFDTVTLTATPNAGYYFKNWIGCPSTNGATCNLNMTKATVIKAAFAKLPKYKLAITKVGSGEIISVPAALKCSAKAKACAAQFVSGTEVTLVPGSPVSAWSGACAGNQLCIFTMDGPKQVKVTFQ